MDITVASPREDEVLIDHYLALWDSYGTPPEHYAENARDQVRAFIAEARHNGLGVFFAEEDDTVAGSAACCLFRSPYPEVIRPDSVSLATSGTSSSTKPFAAAALAGR